jgi:hypothetical protein
MPLTTIETRPQGDRFAKARRRVVAMRIATIKKDPQSGACGMKPAQPRNIISTL